MVGQSILPIVVQLLALVGGAAGQKALLVVDVQDCFLEGGSLAVPAGHIIEKINQIRNEKDCLFDVVIRTQDFHPANHISFGSTHGLGPFTHLTAKGGLPITCEKPSSGLTSEAACCPTQHINPGSVDCTTELCPPDTWTWTDDNLDFVTNNPACTACAANSANCFQDTQAMWTDHCMSTSGGDANFPSNLTTKTSDIIVQKGTNQYVDAYSAFMDNSKFLKTNLDAELQRLNVTELYVAGIATDVCVKWTVRDALGSSTGNYNVKVITDASAGLATGATPTKNHEDAIAWMDNQGATLVTTADILAMDCPVEVDLASRCTAQLAAMLAMLAAAAFGH